MIRIVSKNGKTSVYLGEHKLERVRKVEFKADYTLTPVLCVELIMPDLVVECDQETKVNVDRCEPGQTSK